jgi:hypothetical protein
MLFFFLMCDPAEKERPGRIHYPLHAYRPLSRDCGDYLASSAPVPLGLGSRTLKLRMYS